MKQSYFTFQSVGSSMCRKLLKALISISFSWNVASKKKIIHKEFFFYCYLFIYCEKLFDLSGTMHFSICSSVGHILLYSLIKVMAISHDMITNGFPVQIIHAVEI